MALSPGDPHSYARPELARVIHTHLELTVDFDLKVLEGKAILDIEWEPSSNEIILDSYGLVVSSVTDIDTQSDLEHQVGHCGTLGSKFAIQLLQNVDNCNNRCKIQIEYKTRQGSPALYWLTPEQTADGKYPFLLSNNKLTYARAWFPCQDTPSIKTTYSAMIVAPMGFTVLMSASSVTTYPITHKSMIYKFSQKIPIPSYAVVIAVGLLEHARLENTPSYTSKIGVWAENKFISSSKQTFLLKTENMLQIAESLCGSYPWDSLNICVLPPSVSHFEIECPCLIFVSATLLGGDISLVCSIARNISQNWTGILVTCANYKHLWLNKSFSMFIYGEILRVLFGTSINTRQMTEFFFDRDLDNLRAMVKIFGTTGLLECLLPTNLIGLSPDEGTRFVPYEKGYMFLIELQNILDKRLSGDFKTFLKFYLIKFSEKSIKTDDWKSYLYSCFPEKLLELNSIDWNFWFNDPNNYPSRLFDAGNTILETVCISLANRWIDSNDAADLQLTFSIIDIQGFYDRQKVYFLYYLHASHTILSIKKIQSMAHLYQFNSHNDEIRFIWLRLCIKSRWRMMVPAALNFAIKFCSPKFTYPIFRDLYKWSDVRETVIRKYSSEGWKMLDEIKDKVAFILRVNWNAHEMVDRDIETETLTFIYGLNHY